MADSDDDIPIFGPMSRAVRAADSDDDTPLFGPMSRAAKMQKLCNAPFTAAREEYLKEEVAGLSQEELNVVAVDEAEFRIGVAESLASTPSKPELEISQSFSEQEDVAREDAARRAAAIMTSFGKGTLKIRKCETLKLNGCNRLQFV
jgi:hypothetical protein